MQTIIQQEIDAIQQQIQKGNAANDSLLGGNLGLVTYYCHLYQQTKHTAHLQKARAILETIIARLNKGVPGLSGASLSTGGAGLGFVICSLAQHQLLDIKEDDELCELDFFLFSAAMEQLDNDLTDCLHGAFGIIHYFCQRAADSIANEYLNRLVEKACNRVVKEPAGYWFRNYTRMQEETDEINFSLSHGLSGMLLILIDAHAKTIHKQAIEDIVLKGTRFIHKHQLYVDSLNREFSFYPLSLKENATEIENLPRMGWCYGDLNVVLLFYRAAALLRDQKLLKLGDLVGMHSVMRKDEASTLITDSHFCHGAAGVAQFYYTLYKERNLQKYYDAYEYWIEQTVIYLQRDRKAGFYAGKEHCLLDGLLGVSLVLSSYVSPEKTDWSRLLFL